MHDTLPVGLVQRVGNLDGVFQTLIEWQPSLLQPLLERVALDVLHDEVVEAVLFTDIVERTDVGMVQATDRTGLTLEAFPALGIVGEVFGKDFDGDGAVQAGVGGAIHLSHSTGTNERRDFVGAESGSCRECHRYLPDVPSQSLACVNTKVGRSWGQLVGDGCR